MKKQRSIVLFLVKFFAAYFMLFTVYSLYLHYTQKKDKLYSCSPITTLVAKQTADVLNMSGFNVIHQQNTNELSVKLILNDQYIAKIIEGCNSVSVIILFLSFIFAFSGSFRITFIYSVLGSTLIYGVNIIRIAFLSVMLYKFHSQQEFLHDIVFPAIIYGLVFLLWVLWIQKFSKY